MASPTMAMRRANTESAPVLFRVVGFIGGWLMRHLTRQDWRSLHSLPADGGIIIIANHISNFDPVALSHFVIWSGRWPYFLAKRELWDKPVLGWLMRSLGQIPVSRNTAHASSALHEATKALNEGKCVVVYVEGTITDDPDGWPMTGRHGAATLAQTTNCPVIPIAQWGAHKVMGFKQPTFPKLIPAQTMQMLLGAPMPPNPIEEGHPQLSRAQLTNTYIDTLTQMVGVLRAEQPPAGTYDSRAGKRVPPQREAP